MRILHDLVVSLERKIGEAKANGDKQNINALHIQIVGAGTKLSEFALKHLKWWYLKMYNETMDHVNMAVMY